MKFLIVSGNPKKDGLNHSLLEAVADGAKSAGADVEILDTGGLTRCRVCGDGWGSCRGQHRCAFGDDGFTAAQDLVRAAHTLCLITPVYWWEMAEGLKCFLDRLRRCEFGESSALSGKPVLLVASAGGTGNGMLDCLDQMARFCRHIGAPVFDTVGVNRWNADYKRETARAAAGAMASGRRPGVTV